MRHHHFLNPQKPVYQHHISFILFRFTSNKMPFLLKELFLSQNNYFYQLSSRVGTQHRVCSVDKYWPGTTWRQVSSLIETARYCLICILAMSSTFIHIQIMLPYLSTIFGHGKGKTLTFVLSNVVNLQSQDLAERNLNNRMKSSMRIQLHTGSYSSSTT